jgi:cation transport regulator ChaC
MNTLQQFVFGYGSLICPHSRAITVPHMAERTVTPVLVRNVERKFFMFSRFILSLVRDLVPGHSALSPAIVLQALGRKSPWVV